GKHGRLVGQDVSDFSIGQSELSATIATAVRFENVALDGIYVPAHVIGEHSAERSVPIAVAFNGRIAGVGSTFFSDVWRISIMGDPSYLRDGDNELALYEITDG